jgi:acetoin utilization deacetylase AcuC-like enzyme
LFDSSNHLHRDKVYHPETPQRITSCVQALLQAQQNDLNVQLVDIAPNDFHHTLGGESEVGVVHHQPFDTTTLDHARAVLLQTHEAYMVTGLEETCKRARQRRQDENKDPLGHCGYMDSGDTFVTTESFGVVQRATATWFHAIDMALSNQRPTLALTRPPGHHATRSSANGFCLVNFAAASALHALQRHKGIVRKVSILDWDVHYGQGVADIVKTYPDQIRYASIHQVPAFPYMGQTKQVIDSNVLTLPMPADTTWTCGYETLLQEALRFLIHSKDNANDNDDQEWIPDLVIICAGYDALGSDELASCSLNAADYGRMTRTIRQILPSHTALMLGLEGGYQLNDNLGPVGNLPQAVVETVRALSE